MLRQMTVHDFMKPSKLAGILLRSEFRRSLFELMRLVIIITILLKVLASLYDVGGKRLVCRTAHVVHLSVGRGQVDGASKLAVSLICFSFSCLVLGNVGFSILLYAALTESVVEAGGEPNRVASAGSGLSMKPNLQDAVDGQASMVVNPKRTDALDGSIIG